jgi:hypothetical protein
MHAFLTPVIGTIVGLATLSLGTRADAQQSIELTKIGGYAHGGFASGAAALTTKSF